MNTQSSEVINAANLARREAELNALPPQKQAIERQKAVVEKWLRKADRARYNAVTEAENAARYDKEARWAQERLEAMIKQSNKSEV